MAAWLAVGAALFAGAAIGIVLGAFLCASKASEREADLMWKIQQLGEALADCREGRS